MAMDAEGGGPDVAGGRRRLGDGRRQAAAARVAETQQRRTGLGRGPQARQGTSSKALAPA